VPCSLCRSDDPEQGFYCPPNDNAYHSCGAFTAAHSAADPAASAPSDCVCLQGYWRNCIDDPDDANPLSGIEHTLEIVDGQEQLTGSTTACTRDDSYFTSNCVPCPSDTVCQFEEFMQHCPLHATSFIGSDEPNDCKCNPGYKPVSV
jgi:hypothetical protein